MKDIRIAIGADHRGFELKKRIIQHTLWDNTQVNWQDVGTYCSQRTDYPLFAQAIAKLIQEKQVHAGIALCGTGIGMAIAANRFKHVFAGVAWNETIARMAKEDDNINVLVLPADFVTELQAEAIIKSWLTAEFKEGRYRQRINMIDAL